MKLNLITLGNKEAVLDTIKKDRLSLPRGLMVNRIEVRELLVDFFHYDRSKSDEFLSVGIVTKGSDGKIHGMLYVDERFRGNGLGKALVSNIVARYPTAIFTPWDKSSLALFSQLYERGVLKDENFEPLSLGFIKKKFDLAGFSVNRG